MQRYVRQPACKKTSNSWKKESERILNKTPSIIVNCRLQPACKKTCTVKQRATQTSNKNWVMVVECILENLRGWSKREVKTCKKGRPTSFCFFAVKNDLPRWFDLDHMASKRGQNQKRNNI